MSWMLRMFLTISLIVLPLYLYVGLRLAGSIGFLYPDLGSRARLVILLVILWLYLLPLGALLSYLLGLHLSPFPSGKAVGWADYLLQYPVWIGFVAVIELVTPYVLVDLLAFASRLFTAADSPLRTSLPPVFAWARIGLAVLALVYVPARVVADTSHVRDSLLHIPVRGLPPQLAGLTITLVGDIQVDRFTGDAKVGQVRRIVEARRPDLLMSAGDLVTSGTDFLGEAEKAVCGLKGSAGTFAVMGDHDIWSAPETIRAIHEKCGWTFLENEHRLLTVHGVTILVTGLTHVYSDRLAAAALGRFLDEAPGADFRILLVHQPAEVVVRLAAEHHYSLVLAGHTHGGQIVLHPLGIPVTGSMRETRFWRGLYTVGETTVMVTRGVGMSLAPIRYGSAAEVSTLVLGD